MVIDLPRIPNDSSYVEILRNAVTNRTSFRYLEHFSKFLSR